MRIPAERTARGATLVELVMTIAILAAGLTGVLAVFNVTAARSADPLLVSQAHSIAASYVEEIVLRSYDDPDGSEVGENRASFDDVDDYDGLAVNGCLSTTAACPVLGSCICDQFGAPVDGLPGYQVTVSVQPATLNGKAAKLVDVVVSFPGRGELDARLSAYRTSY